MVVIYIVLEDTRTYHWYNHYQPGTIEASILTNVQYSTLTLKVWFRHK